MNHRYIEWDGINWIDLAHGWRDFVNMVIKLQFPKNYCCYSYELQMGSYQCQWYYNKTQHTNTHITKNTEHKVTETAKN
jgi:hypothetical protein